MSRGRRDEGDSGLTVRMPIGPRTDTHSTELLQHVSKDDVAQSKYI